MSTSHQNQQVAEHWASVAERQELGFWNTPGWFEHQNYLGSGDPKKSWLLLFRDLLRSQNIAPGHALSLGCGSGQLEREMIQEGLCHSVEGCDISPALLKIAAEEAAALNLPVAYYTADLNRPEFPSENYDLIIGAGIFHHVENLEGLFLNLKSALKKGGRLLMYDYVGPSRFQWSQKQIERCNYWLNQLPERFKRKQGYPKHYYFAKSVFDRIPFSYSASVDKLLKKWTPQNFYAQFVRLKTAQVQMKKVIPPHPDQFLVTDPSEAVRSSEILPVLKQHFEIETIIPQGGTLAQPIFGRTVANFIGDQEGQEWAGKILADERLAIQQGELPSDFIAVIARAN